MKNRYSICQMFICPFNVVNNKKLPDLNYPVRICIFDSLKKIVVDVFDELEYDFIQTVSGINFVDDLEEKIKENKRYAIYPSNYYMLDEKSVKKSIKIVERLKNGEKFLKGNEQLNNKDYLLKRQSELKKHKKKILKRGK